MAEIKADLSDQNITVKRMRTLLGFEVDAEKETVEVRYREIHYTGTVGDPDYVEKGRTLKSYNSDFATWLAAQAGQDIKAAIEASLAQEDPNA